MEKTLLSRSKTGQNTRYVGRIYSLHARAENCMAHIVFYFSTKKLLNTSLWSSILIVFNVQSIFSLLGYKIIAFPVVSDTSLVSHLTAADCAAHWSSFLAYIVPYLVTFGLNALEKHLKGVKWGKPP